MSRKSWVPLLLLAAAPFLLPAADAAAATVDCQPGWIRYGGGCEPPRVFVPQMNAPPPSSYTGPMPSFRDNAIWNAVSASGRFVTPSDGAGAAQTGGTIAYDVFTVPESERDVGLVARLGVAGGYSGNGNRFIDVVLGLGAGYTVGDFTLMALCWLAWDRDTGGDAPALQVPSGLAAGPELHGQVWLARWLSLDLSAARLYRFTSSADDPALDVGAETRLGAAFGLGESTGASLGASYVDYGIGRAVLASLAVRWGARGR